MKKETQENFTKKISLTKTYQLYLLFTNLFFAFILVIALFISIIYYGQRNFKSLLRHAKMEAQLLAESHYFQYLNLKLSGQKLFLSEDELRTYSREKFFDLLKEHLEKNYGKVVRFEVIKEPLKGSFSLYQTNFSFEPLEIRLILYIPQNFLIRWHILPLGVGLLIIGIFLLGLYLIQMKYLKRLSFPFKRITKELTTASRLSPTGFEEIDQLIGAINNALEREKELVEKLATQQKMYALGTLAGGYAHEFNNILQIIASHLQLIEKFLKENRCEPIFIQLKKASQTLLRGQNLARKILYLTKSTESEVTDLINFLRELEETFRVLIPKYIILEMQLPEEEVIVPLSEESIKEIMVNLIKNSIDACEAKKVQLENYFPKISIQVEREGDLVSMIISDNGIGMTEEVKRHLFEPFFTTKERTKGTGLGLYMVWNLVTQVGGKIEVHSNYLQGTTFKIYLPLTQKKRATPEYIHPKRESVDFLLRRVLVVDDEEGIRETLAEFLKMNNLEVETAENGLSAWELLKKNNYDLVFLDMYMPEKGGDFVIQKMLKEWDRPLPKIVLMTGYAGEMEDLVKEALEKGVIWKILRKPFSFETIVNILTGGGVENEVY